MTGTPVRVCRRILDDADGVTYRLGRNDAEGAMVARYGEEGDALTARLGAEGTRGHQLASGRSVTTQPNSRRPRRRTQDEVRSCCSGPRWLGA